MSVPYQWQPNIVAVQLFKIGNLLIAAVPGEFTTMAGRRLRDTIKKVAKEEGAAEDTFVTIAGLSNIYSSYITTPEEYNVKYINETKKKSKHIKNG